VSVAAGRVNNNVDQMRRGKNFSCADPLLVWSWCICTIARPAARQ
jgi:hypothetical protein